jgi:hypothetical protein
MQIQVLYVAGCPNYQPTIDLIRSLAPQATIEPVEIKAQVDAVRMRFLGSPTILVDGVDIEPAARARTDFGFACRTYNGNSMPSRELVAWAIGSGSPDARATGNRFAGTSVLLAAIASVCCWLPLVLLGLGVSSVALVSTAEWLRPWLVGGSVALLGAGFYSAYRSQTCCTPRARRLNRAMVWAASAVVLAFALMPLYADALVGACCSTTSDSACCTSESEAPAVQQTALVEPKSSVTVLSDDARELKEGFNADKTAPRVLLIVSPLCPACRAGASAVQKEALAQIDHEKLKIYVVWINRFPFDSLKAAQNATKLVSDKRALHFWDGSGALGKQFGKVVSLPGGKTFAWDVYFVFEPNVEWRADPPTPAYWMHQLGGSETGNVLNGDKFREAITKQLPKGQ